VIILWALIGALVGVANAWTLWWTVGRLRPDEPGNALWLVLGGMGVRLAIVTALLIVGLKSGAARGLIAFGGLWLARSTAVMCVQANGVPWPVAWASGYKEGPQEGCGSR
jgi:hypothetical protein